MMTKFSKYLYVATALIFIVGAYFVLSKKSAEAPVENNNAVIEDREEVPAVVENKKLPEKPATKPEVLPEKILIQVPFTSQAPFAKWDAYHEEACEEASLIMLKYYLDKKTLTPEKADQEILSMINYEIKKLGHYEDSDAREMVKIAEDFYGIKNLKVVYDFKKEDLKKYLALGRPIIVPAAGRMLGNPNFKSPGPLYHALVLKGYEGDTVITNDPGTRKGESYEYDIDTLYAAIHDFPGKPEDITQGRKAMIILE